MPFMRMMHTAVFATAALFLTLLLCGAPVFAHADEQARGSETVKVFTDASGSVTKAEVTKDSAGSDADPIATDGSKVPIKIRVSYVLDGKDVSADELAGASGKLTIRFDYENASESSVNVSGTQESVHTPFTVMTALLFDSGNFKNVTTENGKVIEDGSSVIVAGYAMPGLKESLDIDDDDTEIPDHFAVTADVTDFEMKSALTIATAGLVSDFDTSKLDMGELSDSTAALKQAASALTAGAAELSEGLGQLSNAASTLSDGARQLDAGAQSARSQVYDLIGVIAQLHDGSSAVSTGAVALEKGVGETKGALDEVIKQLDAVIAAAASSGAQSDSAQLIAEAIAEVQKDATALVTVTEKTAQASTDVQNAITTLSAIDENKLTDTEKQALQTALTSLQSANTASDQAATGISTQALQNLASQGSQGDPSANMLASLTALKEALQKISDGMGDKGLHGGAVKLVEGAAQVEGGLAALVGNSGALQAGVDALASGTNQLSTGSQQLAEGASSAASGSGELAAGMSQFENEGIGSIVELVDGRLAHLSSRMKATVQAGKDYTTFTGDSDDVKFVFETSGISR